LRLSKTRDYTFMLTGRKLHALEKRNKIEKRVASGPHFLRSMWRDAAEIRGVLDEAKASKKGPTRGSIWLGGDPRRARLAGRFVYHALLKQSIVATVAAWEAFFRGTVVYVLNRPAFIAILASRRDRPFRKIAKEFGLSEDILLQFASVGFSVSAVKLGSAFANSRRIHWQNLRQCRKLLRILFPDVDILQFAANWSRLIQFFEDRNVIVHKSGLEERKVTEQFYDGTKVVGPVKVKEAFPIVEKYTPKKVENFLDELLAISEKLHSRQFSTYERD